jgi:hypothetical protein
MKIFSIFKKVNSTIEHINNLREQPQKVCDICYGIGLVDHEDAEFRTRKHWCQCKKPKEINESNRFWWCYDMFSKNSFTLMQKPIKDGCSKELPIIDKVFEPTIGVVCYDDKGFLGVDFYVKKKKWMSNEIYWEHHSYFNYRYIIEHRDLCHVLFTKLLESGIGTVYVK